MALLVVSNLTKNFDGITAVSKVSFSVAQSEIFAIIGPNGAGKTTTFNLVSGVLAPDCGEIFFRGERISGLKPHEIALRGMVRTFQTISLFDTMTVLDNVKVGCHGQARTHIFSAAFRTRAFFEEEVRMTRTALETLRLLGLERRAHEMVGNLPFGQQRLVDIARALAGEPVLLLLDEPAAGMNARERSELMAIIRTLKQRGMTIVLIEHDMDLIMEIAERIIVLDHGEKIAEGKPEEIQRNPDVIAAYLGEA
ncbi:MAG: ABC transporter ATP-binding protein [Desulfobacterota bacterium]|nr:ABC transporter ATP-binding protein [Thermodesulfobacteriota bacterium]